MTTKKKTTAKEQPVIETPAYNEDSLMEFKVKKVTHKTDIKSDLQEQSDISIRLQIIEKEIKDVKAFIRNHFGINFRDYEKETRG